MRVAKHSLAIDAKGDDGAVAAKHGTVGGARRILERKFCWGVECGAEIWYNMW